MRNTTTIPLIRALLEVKNRRSWKWWIRMYTAAARRGRWAGGGKISMSGSDQLFRRAWSEVSTGSTIFDFDYRPRNKGKLHSTELKSERSCFIVQNFGLKTLATTHALEYKQFCFTLKIIWTHDLKNLVSKKIYRNVHCTKIWNQVSTKNVNKKLLKITDERRPQLHLNVKKVERGAEHGEPSPLECIDLGDPAYSQDSHTRSR